MLSSNFIFYVVLNYVALRIIQAQSVCQLSDIVWINFVATCHGDSFLFIAVF